MLCNILTIPEFDKNVKKLSKKYRNIKIDLEKFIDELKKNPTMGTPLIGSCYKIRVANSSVPVGKSGGFRVITYFIDKDNNIYLLTIYSKSDASTIADFQILELLKKIN
ncbi:MAG: addiction module toxin RelE [Sulfurimonas sp.]|nr:addiction module toxin RelE [Sulfurimonas sp.]